MNADSSKIKNCSIHDSARIVGFANLYGCSIGEDCLIGPFVEIGANAVIGNRTRISSHSYICDGTIIGEDCFIAHGCYVTNDDFREPEVYSSITELSNSWKPKFLKIGNCVRVGSGAVLLPVTIGDHSIIGAGSVVTRDVPPFSIVAGNPARLLRTIQNPVKYPDGGFMP